MPTRLRSRSNSITLPDDDTTAALVAELSRRDSAAQLEVVTDDGVRFVLKQIR